MNPFDANNQRFVARLRQEVEAWRQDGTVTAEQAQAILARYPEYAPATRRPAGDSPSSWGCPSWAPS